MQLGAVGVFADLLQHTGNGVFRILGQFGAFPREYDPVGVLFDDQGFQIQAAVFADPAGGAAAVDEVVYGDGGIAPVGGDAGVVAAAEQGGDDAAAAGNAPATAAAGQTGGKVVGQAVDVIPS